MKNIFNYRGLVAGFLFPFVLLSWSGNLAAQAPRAFTQPATMVTGSSARLNGMATPNAFSTVAWFEWGTNTSYGNTTPPVDVGDGTRVVAINSSITGLLSGVVYHHRLVASNSMGVAYGADRFLAVGKKVWAWGSKDNVQTNLPPGLSNVVAIGAGGAFALVLKTDGTVVNWEDGGAPGIVPPEATNVAAIATGLSHSMALKGDGSLVAWVSGIVYQNQGAITPPIPTNVPTGLPGVVAIACSADQNLVLSTNGYVWLWDGYSRVKFPPSGLSNVVAITAGNSHYVALKNDGSVFAWGDNYLGQTNVPSGLNNVVAISAGGAHTLALKSDGTVVAWGHGLTYAPEYSRFGQSIVPAGLSNVVAVAGGGVHSLALKSDGTMVAWGAGTNYANTNSTYGQSIIPPGLSNVVAMDGGGGFSLVLALNTAPTANPQTAYGFANHDLVLSLVATDAEKDPTNLRITSLPTAGKLYQFQGGNRGAEMTETNAAVEDLRGRVVFVPDPDTSGSPYTTFQFRANDGSYDSFPASVLINIQGAPFAITRLASLITGTHAQLNGVVAANFSPTTAWFEWGTNANYGNQTLSMAVGRSDSVTNISSTITGLTPRLVYHYRVAASNSQGIVYGVGQRFTVGRKVWAWGYASATNAPAGLNDIVALSGGSGHCLALKEGGTVTAWGNDQNRQSQVPFGLSNVVQVAAGGYHSLALKNDGRVVTWGADSSGQSSVPADLTNIVEIAAGGYHSVALKRDGTLIAWGAGLTNSGAPPDYGQSIIPVGLSNVVAVSAGGYHTLALKCDGTVAAWGAGLGTNDFSNNVNQSNVPEGLSNVVAIAAGFHHSLALKNDRLVAAWGRNSWGQSTVPNGLTNVIAVAGGTYHNSVLKADGTIVAWSSRSIPLAPPGDFSSAVAISAGLDYTLALAPNLAPKATSQLTNGYASRDTVLTLAGTDSDTDVLKFKIVTLPALGTLYQYAGGSRSLSMLDANTTVSDPLGRVIFAPVPDTYGSPYANLQFVANDGTYDSTAATVTINLVQFRISSYSRASNGSFQLGFNGLTNAVYNVFASTNLTNWLQIGPAIQLSPGLFQFGDPTATNYQQRFYQLRAP